MAPIAASKALQPSPLLLRAALFDRLIIGMGIVQSLHSFQRVPKKPTHCRRPKRFNTASISLDTVATTVSPICGLWPDDCVSMSTCGSYNTVSDNLYVCDAAATTCICTPTGCRYRYVQLSLTSTTVTTFFSTSSSHTSSGDRRSKSRRVKSTMFQSRSRLRQQSVSACDSFASVISANSLVTCLYSGQLSNGNRCFLEILFPYIERNIVKWKQVEAPDTVIQ